MPQGFARSGLYYNRGVSAEFLPVLWRSIKVTLRVLWRVTRQLFHEATGVLFCLFAIYGGMAAWREWKYRPTAWVISFAILYALMMAVFGFTAFRRAKKVQ